MRQVHCEVHNVDILIYHRKHRKLFKDDNRQEVAVFFDDNGRKYLKRFLPSQCDENCETIKQILEENK